jgi:hypothetical protein
MTASTQPTTKNDREARLAEQLRANLRRRKAQARGVEEGVDPALDTSSP